MKTVLVVEDDKRYQRLLKEALQGEIRVLTAEDGKNALEIIEKEKVDLILLDLLMPGIDGIGFYYQLENKLKKHIPIIVLTNVVDTAAYGVDIKEVMIKANVSLEQVVDKVRKYL